jgi:hypothetical protein
MEEKTPFYKQIWFLGGIATLAIFALCFVALNYVGSPDKDEVPDVENEVIATLQTNEPLIQIARQQGWIDADATELTSVDVVAVKSIDSVFVGSDLQSFTELRYFLSLKEIHAGAFAHSNQLKEITVPANVSAIDYGAFADCPALETLSVDAANTYFDSRDNCNGIICTWKGKLMLVAGCKNTVLSDRVYHIAPQAFRGCKQLTSVTFPDRMESIGDSAFMDCSSLREVTVPQGVRFVGPATFMNCTALQTVNLPKSIERLQKDAFKGCTGLSKIICPKKYPPIIDDAFDSYEITVYVPEGLQNKYFSDKFWKPFKDVKELK